MGTMSTEKSGTHEQGWTPGLFLAVGLAILVIAAVAAAIGSGGLAAVFAVVGVAVLAIGAVAKGVQVGNRS